MNACVLYLYMRSNTSNTYCMYYIIQVYGYGGVDPYSCCLFLGDFSWFIFHW